MNEVDAAFDQARSGDLAGAAARLLAVIRGDPGIDRAWMGLVQCLALAGQADMILGLVGQRAALRGDGFLFLHGVATLLVDLGLSDTLDRLAALATDPDQRIAILYGVGCARLLANDEDAAFAAFRPLKALLRERAAHLPIGAESPFNVAYRQATLVEDGDYLEALVPDRVAEAAAALPVPEAVGAWRAGEGPFVLMAACDGRYFHRFAPEFLRSLDARASGLTVHLHVVEPGEGTLDLARVLAAGSANIVNLSVEGANPHAGPAYYSCARFLAAKGVVEAWRRPVLLADIDVAFTDTPERVARAAEGCAFATFTHDSHGPCSRLPAVLTWFAADADGAAALDGMRRFVLSKLDVPWPYNWMLDQAGLMCVRRWLRRARPGARIGDLNALVGGRFTLVLSSLGTEDEKGAMIRAAAAPG